MGFEAETEKTIYFNKIKRIDMHSASEDFQLWISKQRRTITKCRFTNTRQCVAVLSYHTSSIASELRAVQRKASS